MSRMEDLLREALKRKEPPAGFAERVLARAASSEPAPGRASRWASLFRRPLVRWAAVAAAVILIVAGAQYQRAQKIRAEGEAAKQQVILAIQITGSKLEVVRQKVRSLAERDDNSAATRRTL